MQDTIMIVADFTMVPMGSGTNAAKYIRNVYELLRESGIKFMPGPMSTSIETKTFEELFEQPTMGRIPPRALPGAARPCSAEGQAAWAAMGMTARSSAALRQSEMAPR